MNEALCSVLSWANLIWPADLQLPSSRFRLFVAADVSTIPVDTLADFATKAIARGMLYFCAWGPDCEHFHDVVDEVIVGDGTIEVANPGTVMTTWHASETLGEALDFFIRWARPAEGFISESQYWLALSLNNAEWESIIGRELRDAQFPPE